MSFDRDGDAGTAAALEDALAQIAEGEGQRVIDMIDNAPPGPIKTRWGLGFRDYDDVHGLHPRLEQHQSPRRRRGAAAALHRLRATDLLRRPVQRCLAGPGARRRSGDPAQEREGQPAAGPLVPAGAARRAAHRRILPGPLAQQPRMHGPARRLAGASRVQVLELLRFGGGGARILPRDREAPARVLPGRDRCTGLQPRRLRQGLCGRPHGRPGQQEPGRERPLRQPRAQRPERQQRPRALPRTAHQEPAELRPHAALHGGRGRREDVAAVRVDQSRQADGDSRAVPVRALRLALLRRPAVHHQLPDLRRPRRRDHPLHLPSRPRVVLVSPADAHRGLDAQVLSTR